MLVVQLCRGYNNLKRSFSCLCKSMMYYLLNFDYRFNYRFPTWQTIVTVVSSHMTRMFLLWEKRVRFMKSMSILSPPSVDMICRDILDFICFRVIPYGIPKLGILIVLELQGKQDSNTISSESHPNRGIFQQRIISRKTVKLFLLFQGKIREPEANQ